VENTSARIVGHINAASLAIAGRDTLLEVGDIENIGVAVGTVNTTLDLVLVIMDVIVGSIIVVRASRINVASRNRASWPWDGVCCCHWWSRFGGCCVGNSRVAFCVKLSMRVWQSLGFLTLRLKKWLLAHKHKS
jgi:hypothetical protein